MKNQSSQQLGSYVILLEELEKKRLPRLFFNSVKNLFRCYGKYLIKLIFVYTGGLRKLKRLTDYGIKSVQISERLT